MKVAKCTLQSVAPYQQGAQFRIATPKGPRENEKDYEDRVWRERGHYDTQGRLFIPPMSFANSLKEAAKYLSIPIPGKGKATYTKHFAAGVMVCEPLVVQPEITRETVKGAWVYCSADGTPGGRKRVWKCFPTILNWKGVVNYQILDDTITLEIFERVLRDSGNFIGIGVFRPVNRGFHGRFEVKKIDWSEVNGNGHK